MTRTITLLAGCAVASLALGQANNYPTGSTVADFTVTDTEGVQHSLYSITSQGKYVILDFFFDTCPPCQATQTYFNQLHETYGCNEGDLFVMSMNNGTDSNAEVIAYEAAYGGTYAHSPAVGIEGGCAAVDAAFGVSAYPTYCLIGPDNIMKNNDIWPVSDMSTFVAAFPPGSNIDVMNCAVGVDEAGELAFISVFPTPSTGLITVSVETGVARNLSVEVYDLLGKRVLIDVLGSMGNGAQRTMDLTTLADGDYILKLLADGQVHDVTRVALSR